MSVATIRKLQENTGALCKIAVKFSQQKADFAAVQNFPLAWSDRLPIPVTPSFQV